MITLWFPKAIYFQPNILNNRLGIYEQRIKGAFSSVETFRDGQKNVDSTHKSHKNILKLADLDWMLIEHFMLHAKQYANAL